MPIDKLEITEVLVSIKRDFFFFQREREKTSLYVYFPSQMAMMVRAGLLEARSLSFFQILSMSAGTRALRPSTATSTARQQAARVRWDSWNLNQRPLVGHSTNPQRDIQWYLDDIYTTHCQAKTKIIKDHLRTKYLNLMCGYLKKHSLAFLVPY